MSFRITGLPAEQFRPLFKMSDAELRQHGAVRQIADKGYPCRVSLTDATPGDKLILVNHEHLPVDSPYRMRFAIFVREGEQRYDEVNTIPDQLRSRTLAARSFDKSGMMVECRLVDGKILESAISDFFEDDRAAFIHLHFAAPGCYAARVDRN